jgi:uncharacterized protein with GYD domain
MEGLLYEDRRAGGRSGGRQLTARRGEACGREPGRELEAVYFAFGDADVYVIADLPDNQSAAALSLAANSSEGLAIQTVVLMTAEDFDAASKKEVSFRPPGD